jgi:hypothetical protein
MDQQTLITYLRKELQDAYKLSDKIARHYEEQLHSQGLLLDELLYELHIRKITLRESTKLKLVKK